MMNIDNFNTKISEKNNMPPWFVDLTKTMNSRGVTFQTWDELVQMLSNATSDINTSIEFLRALWNIIENVGTTESIKNNAVTAEKLANNSVTTEKIANEAVTPEKLSETYVTFDDLATDNKAGVVKVFPDSATAEGIGITSAGVLGVVNATKARIDEAKLRRVPVGVDNFAYAVRKALVNPTERPVNDVVPLVWTEDQQFAARKTLGIDTYVADYVQEFFDGISKAEESEF